MRYDTPVYFRRVIAGAYDTATGDYSEPTIKETEVYASVMDTKDEKKQIVYGRVSQESYTVHVQNFYTKPFDFIRIGEKLYQVDKKRNLRTKGVYIVSEVQ